MELSIQPEMYTPDVDFSGNYIECMTIHCPNGMYCPCGSRKDKIFKTSSQMMAHMKTKMHQKWLVQLNWNKTNYFRENEELKETIRIQKQMLTKLENDIQTKILTIDFLTKMVQQSQVAHTNVNLLNYD